MKTTKQALRLLILFLLLTYAYKATAQVDSNLVKLKTYKDYYQAGLIDSAEYVALKARLLGIEPKVVIVQPPPRKQKVLDTLVYYNTTRLETILPEGLYMSINEIKAQKPSLHCSIKLERRNNYDYENGVGGNIMLFADDECIGRNKLKMDAWLYSTGVRCYINLERLKLQAFYSPVITMGRFLAFYKNETSKVVENANNWGGSIGSEIAMATGHDYKKLYVIDTQSSMLYPVTDEYMKKSLEDYPELLKKYNTEQSENNELWARYLQLANDIK